MLKTLWNIAKHAPVIGTTLREIEDTTARLNFYADESNPLPDNILDMLGVARRV